MDGKEEGGSEQWDDGMGWDGMGWDRIGAQEDSDARNARTRSKH